MKCTETSTKSELATRRFKVLSDENRRAVISYLIQGRFSVNEIAEKLGIERTLLSHHLRVLRSENLVVAEREGKEIFYSIHQDIVLDHDDPVLDLECCQVRFL